MHGFTSKKARDEHQKRHRSRLRCEHRGCDYAILGFPTRQALATHLADYDLRQPGINFPKIQRASLTEALEEAIDLDDFVSVRNLSNDLSVFPRRHNGFLLRAVKKRNLEALKGLQTTMGSIKDLEFRDEKGMAAIHYIAENNEEEMAKLIIQMGANVNIGIKDKSNRRVADSSDALKIASSRSHTRIVKLLLDHNTQNKNKLTPSAVTLIDLAAKSGHAETSQILLDAAGEAVELVDYPAVKSAASHG